MAWITNNYPGLRCFTSDAECSVPCKEEAGYIQPCHRPKFFGWSSPSVQDPLWNELTTGVGILLTYSEALLSIDGWFGGIWPLPPGIHLYSEPVGDPANEVAKVTFIIRRVCDSVIDPPTTADWKGEITLENYFSQSSFQIQAFHMEAAPICPFGAWPVPPFDFTPLRCCEGVAIDA